MMKTNPWNWKGLLLGLAGPLLGFGTATAQNPTSVDIDLRMFTTPSPARLEVRIRANGQGYTSNVSALTFAIRWETGTGVSLGSPTNNCAAINLVPQPQVTNPSGNGFNYVTYNAFGVSDLGTCSLTANTYRTIATIPILQSTAVCKNFNIVNDTYTGQQTVNSNYFISLGGVEKTGVIDAVVAQYCLATDCLAIPGGTTGPGTACDDGDECTINDVYSSLCVCTGTQSGDPDGDGICTAVDDCPNLFGVQGDPCNDGNPNTTNDVITAACVCQGIQSCTPPSAVVVGSNSPICSTSTLNLTVTNAGTGPFTYAWTGAGTFSPSNTAQNPSVTGAATGTYSCTVTNACGNSPGNTSVTVAAAPTTATAGGPQTICANGTTTSLGGNTATSGTGAWSVVSGGTGTFSNAASPTSTFTHTGGAGPVVVRWTISNAPCTASTANVTITISPDTDGDGVCDLLDNCPTVSGQQGSACNDNNVCTINDVLNASCVCVGTFQDTDGDGVCNANDNCPTVSGQQGSACNDNNVCTINDVLNASCVCVGTFQDTDGDGICNANDNCPNVAGVQGTACNDNNACTDNDVLNASCVCAGTLNNTDTDGDGVPNCSDNCPTVVGQVGSSCNDGNPLTINDELGATCVCAGTPVSCVTAGDCNDQDPCTSDACVANACVYTPITTDTDGDGVPNCSDNCPNVTGQIGSACNDGNACTDNDVLNASCVCAGTLNNTDTDGDGVPNCADNCPAVAGQQGSACDDGNALTINDVLNANCVCVGTTVGCVVTGDCNDNDDCTSDDCVSNACVYTPITTDTDGDGTPDCSDNCPNVAGQIGSTCDDGNALTINDALNANCVCVGTTVSCVVNGDCIDNDACTSDACVANACVYTPLPDGDNDGTCDAQDGCPTDPNKIAPGICGCGFADTDTDGDGSADCIDPCPIVANVAPGDPCNDGNPLTINDQYNANCVCAGTPVSCAVAADCNDQDPCTVDACVTNACVYSPAPDTDGDGTCDASDGCPNDANKIAPGVCGCGNPEPGTACNDNNAGTINDQIGTNCVCAGTPLNNDCLGIPGGTALPGTACNDNNANTGNDTWSANCECIGQVIDCLGVPGGTATVGSACNDADACTTGDVYSANCVCAGTFQDTDGDGVCNANDNCPNVAGQIGSVCNDNNPNTINDVLNANCQCQGTPIGGCTENLTLSITLDANGSQTSWVLYDATEVGILDQGGPYTNGTPGAVITEDICVPAGCYHLRFSDSGNDGITGGGYVLRNASNKRIIDASVGSFTTTSEIGGVGARNFCVPIGALQILNNWCDRTNLLITSPVYCNAQPGATGYQWWIYNPHGTYNRRVTTTTNIMSPNYLFTNPIPLNTFLNLRARPVFSGGPGEFGPACRVRFIPNTAGPGREILFDEGTSVTMSLYPNPNRDGLVTLSMEGVDVADETMIDIDIYDMLGKRVFAERAVAAEGVVNHRMDLSAVTGAGLYMVNVTIEGKLYTQRLVIQ